MRLAVAEAERERRVAAAGEVELRGLHEVALGRVRRRVGQRVRVVELGEAVARRARVAVGDLAEAAVGVERRVDRDRVVAIGGVGRRHGVGADQQRVAAGARDRAGVRARVVGAAAAVAVEVRVEADVELVVRRLAAQRLEVRAHDDGRAVGVGHVVGDDPVAAALGGRGHAAGQRAVVGGRDAVGHVARLQVGERAAVGDEVLQRLDVGVVGGGEEDVREDAVGDREPGLRAPIARRPDAVLARDAVVRERTRLAARRAARRRLLRLRAARQPDRGRRRRDDHPELPHGGSPSDPVRRTLLVRRAGREGEPVCQARSKSGRGPQPVMFCPKTSNVHWFSSAVGRGSAPS